MGGQQDKSDVETAKKIVGPPITEEERKEAQSPVGGLIMPSKQKTDVERWLDSELGTGPKCCGDCGATLDETNSRPGLAVCNTCHRSH